MEIENIKTIVFWIIFIFHLFISLFLLFSPYFSNNNDSLYFILFGFFIYFISNKILGFCIITYFEHILRPDLVPDTNRSYMQLLLANIIGEKNAENIFKYIPMISLSIILYKITISSERYDNEINTDFIEK